MQKLLIINNQTQFGYHIDSYKYCQYLGAEFDITYISQDKNLEKVSLPNVHAIYLAKEGNSLTHKIKFVKAVRNIIKEGSFDLFFIIYFRGSSLLRLATPSHATIIDVRTGCVHRNPYHRWFKDLLLRLEVFFYKEVSIISTGLIKNLKLGYKKPHVIPLGSDIISHVDKLFTSFKLIYVGTFNNRHIDTTIAGFARFYEEYKDKISITYTIIGAGDPHEEKRIQETIKKYNLQEVVNFVGVVPHPQLHMYFDSHNIGVSFVPITKYFDCQPPTKTFEYLLSGIPTIATNTSENNKLIDDNNGVLIEDNEKSFYKGLVKLYEHRHFFKSSDIRQNALSHTWKGIVHSNLRQYLNKISGKRSKPSVFKSTI